MNNISPYLPATALLIALASNPGTLAGEPEVSRVKSELPAAARRLDGMFAQVQGTARLWYVDRRASSKSLLTEARFAIDHGMEKVELGRFTQEPKPKKLGEFVYCVAEDSAFQLHRLAGKTAYEVHGIGRTSSDRDRYATLFGRFVTAHHGVMGRRLSRVLESPGFEITGAETVEEGGRKLMRADCVQGSGPIKNQFSLLLDPGAGWIVRSCRYRPFYYPEAVFRFDVEYDEARAGSPLPRHVRITEEPFGVTHYCDFTDWTFAPTPLSEFSMTHYGLPDLIRTRRARNTLPYWLAGIAGLAGVAAFVLRRMTSHKPV
jgi:hypothetical protein